MQAINGVLFILRRYGAGMNSCLLRDPTQPQQGEANIIMFQKLYTLDSVRYIFEVIITCTPFPFIFIAFSAKLCEIYMFYDKDRFSIYSVS